MYSSKRLPSDVFLIKIILFLSGLFPSPFLCPSLSVFNLMNTFNTFSLSSVYVVNYAMNVKQLWKSHAVGHSLSAVLRVKNIVFDLSLRRLPVKSDSAPQLHAIAPRPFVLLCRDRARVCLFLHYFLNSEPDCHA